MILIVHILQQISFAKNRSDAVVKKLDAEHFDQHKSARAENKSTFLPSFSRAAPWPDSHYVWQSKPGIPIRSRGNSGRSVWQPKVRACCSFYHVRPTDFRQTVEGAAAPAPKRPAVQMPDEYLPPNKILFLQNLPESVTKDQLMALFSQYVTLLIYENMDLSDMFV